MRVCVYGASSTRIEQIYIDEGEKLGEGIAARRWGLVFGAGANGLMGAAARGATRGEGKIIGVVPTFFQNVDGELYDKCTDLVYTETMRRRKQTMEELADAFIIAPGGVGTMDEFFEILTLRHLKQHKKPIAILNTNGFYDDLIDLLKEMVETKFLIGSTLDCLLVSSDPEEVLDMIQKEIEENEEQEKEEQEKEKTEENDPE